MASSGTLTRIVNMGSEAAFVLLVFCVHRRTTQSAAPIGRNRNTGRSEKHKEQKQLEEAAHRKSSVAPLGIQRKVQSLGEFSRDRGKASDRLRKYGPERDGLRQGRPGWLCASRAREARSTESENRFGESQE